MFSLFNTPTWFNGIDLIFALVTLVISLFIARYSWKVYRLTSENKFKYFSIAFGLVILALCFKLVTYGILYFNPVREIVDVTLQPITQGENSIRDLFYRAGYFLQMLSTLGAWLLIFFVSQKSRARLNKFYEVSQILLFIYLVVLISIVGNFKYFVFYLTSLVLLSLIVLNYYKNYLNNNRNENSLLVMWAFLLIAIAQVFFIFVFLWSSFYFLGEFLTLIGFLLIFYVYRKIIKK
ncbi:hypothetical protein HN385_00490 [archaeon]|jgi:hypothetical protein|nr:hypothetical protein [archaeon]MBT3451599.1 hypothetical protein [archaeon]MBT6869619.1 hypothetical protein [archaeon]MBT7192388.1 hypothetical protein [archaeon]MBT7380189.1 hypothetical protein [archaeon]